MKDIEVYYILKIIKYEYLKMDDQSLFYDSEIMDKLNNVCSLNKKETKNIFLLLESEKIIKRFDESSGIYEDRMLYFIDMKKLDGKIFKLKRKIKLHNIIWEH